MKSLANLQYKTGKKSVMDSLGNSHFLNLWEFYDCCGTDEVPP